MNRRTDDPTIASVINDETEGVRHMLNHLVALGHRSIATIAGNQALSTGQRRYEAFLRHAVEMGLDVGPSRVGFASTFKTKKDGETLHGELMARGGDFYGRSLRQRPARHWRNHGVAQARAFLSRRHLGHRLQ